MLPKARKSPKERRERTYSSKKEGELKTLEVTQKVVTVSINYTRGNGLKVDNNTNLDYQVDNKRIT